MSTETMERGVPILLKDGNLPRFPNMPIYDRRLLKPAIAHIGVGGFHRAHAGVYLDDLANRGHMEWGEVGIGLLPGDVAMAKALRPQDCLYTVVERSVEQDVARVVGSMNAYLLAREDPRSVVAALTDPAIRIVTLTITESGYALTTDADSAFGYLTRALHARWKANVRPFSILSCDNVEQNGPVTKDAVLFFARASPREYEPEFVAWIEGGVAFPSCMVDRITPKRAEGDQAMVAQQFGIEDAWPVMTEPFRQWVIEDTFCNGRPPLEDCGVEYVHDVVPSEKMKMYLLNASHQALAYLGPLAGYTYVHEAILDEDFAQFIQRMMHEEVEPLLQPIPGVDFGAYQTTLLRRFGNHKIADTLERLSEDGSERMRKFLLPSLHHALARGQQHPHRMLTLALAAWCRYLVGKDVQGRPLEVRKEKRLHALQPKARASLHGGDVQELLSDQEVFGDLAQRETFVEELNTIFLKLDTDKDAKKTLAAYLRLH